MTINSGYIAGLLAKSLVTAASHEDAATRARADEKIRRFADVLSGMASGDLSVGSRTPVKGAPAWATLEVVKGGFATGALLAGGALLPHEEEALAKPGLPNASTPRARLNLRALTDDGVRELAAMVEDGRYRIDVPEEGALLVAAWLLTHGERARAIEVIDVIAPFFDRLRFYPAPSAQRVTESAVVRVQPVSKTRAVLEARQVRPQIAKMNETLRVWIPFEDRVVSLFRETVVDGVPLARIPEDLPSRARALHDEYGRLRKEHTLSKRHADPKSSLGRLVHALGACARGAKWVPVERLRQTLDAIEKKRGAPGSERLTTLRATQSAVAALPTYKELASVLAARLRALPDQAGIANIDPFTQPLSDDEAKSIGCAAGTSMPEALTHALLRSLEAPIETLVEREIIPSSEVLAEVAPQITAHVRAAGINDPSLRRLYGAIYGAFRRRRSLLLLNLEHQVRIDELPWVAAMESQRKDALGATSVQAATLEQLATLAIVSFPDVILPNKLITELAALSKGAGVELPLVEELAADIFMGTFSGKFVSAAKIAARMLRGTLYERYYGVSFADVLALPDVGKAKKRARSATASPEFAAMCEALARSDSAGHWSVARNGTIIEQEQILTTHNLAALFDALSLADKLDVRLLDLARTCFKEICKAQAVPFKKTEWHAHLLRLKNSAYAWRQMMFFLSVAPRGAVDEFIPWADAHLADAGVPQLAPALRGLKLIAAGGAFDAEGHADHDGDARRFLGWTIGKHWLTPSTTA